MDRWENIVGILNFSIRIRLFGIALALCLTAGVELRAQLSPSKVLSGEEAVKESARKPWAEILAGAQKGDAALQYVAAWRLFHGEGVEQDPSAGIRWFKKAADQNVPEAQFKMGVVLGQGINCVVDHQLAQYWFSRSATNGYIPAVFSLNVYFEGEEKTKLVMKAAEAGYPIAGIVLCDPKYQFQIVRSEEQWKMGMSLCKSLAEAGDDEAQYSFGSSFFDERRWQATGDPIDALKWLYLANDKGHHIANSKLHVRQLMMSAEHLAEARKRADAFKPVPSTNKWLHAGKLLVYLNPAPLGLAVAQQRSDFKKLREEANSGDPRAAFQLALSLQHQMPVIDWEDIDKQTRESGVTNRWSIRMASPLKKDVPDISIDEIRANFQKAAESGIATAALALGCIDAHYRVGIPIVNGKPSSKSMMKATGWWQKASDAGNSDAQYELGKAYATAYGVERSYSLALRYLRMASAGQHEEARELLTRLFGQNSVEHGIAAIPVNPAQSKLLRLAAVPMKEGLATETDLLTAEFSKRSGVEMLERSEIQRIHKELGLGSQGLKNPLQLGQVLRADGLLLLDTVVREGRQRIAVKLVDVAKGVTLTVVEQEHPLKDEKFWSELIGRRLSQHLPGLRESGPGSVAVSLSNLRSTVASPRMAAMEREMRMALFHQLLQQPDIVMLERTSMGSILAESQFEGWENRELLTGTFLIDGTFEPTGAGTSMKLTLRIIESASRKTRTVEKTGNVGELVVFMRDVGKDVIRLLHRKPEQVRWDALEEAAYFCDEAEWCLRWGMVEEGRSAIANCIGLGLRTQGPRLIQMKFLRGGPGDSIVTPLNQAMVVSAGRDNQNKLDAMNEAVDFYLDFTQHMPAGWEPDAEFENEGNSLLGAGVSLLEEYFNRPVARIGLSKHLAVTRAKLLQLSKQLSIRPASRPALAGTLLRKGGLLMEKPSDQMDFILTQVRKGFEIEGGGLARWHLEEAGVPLWSWDGRKSPEELKGLWKSGLEQLASGKSFPADMEAMLVLLSLAGPDSERVIAATRLMDATEASVQQIPSSLQGRSFLREVTMGVKGVLNVDPVKFPESARLFSSRYESFESRVLPKMVKASPTLGARPTGMTASTNAPRSIQLGGPGIGFPGNTPVNAPVQRVEVQLPVADKVDPQAASPFPKSRHPPKFWMPPIQEKEYQGLFRGLRFKGWKYADDSLWAVSGFRFKAAGGGNQAAGADTVPSIYRINLPSLETERITIPVWKQAKPVGHDGFVEELQFEILNHVPFVFWNGQLAVREGVGSTWRILNAELPKSCTLVALAGHLLVFDADNLLDIDPQTGGIRTLASVRRRPAITPMDELGSLGGVQMLEGPDGSMVVLVADKAFRHTFKNGEWMSLGNMPHLYKPVSLMAPEGLQLSEIEVDTAMVWRRGSLKAENIAKALRFDLDSRRSRGYHFPSQSHGGSPGMFGSPNVGLMAFDQRRVSLLEGGLQLDKLNKLCAPGETIWSGSRVLRVYDADRTVPARITLDFVLTKTKDLGNEIIYDPRYQANPSQQFRIWSVKQGLIAWHPGLNGFFFVPWTDLEGLGVPMLTDTQKSDMARLIQIRKQPSTDLSALSRTELILKDEVRRLIRSYDKNDDGRLSAAEFVLGRLMTSSASIGGMDRLVPPGELPNVVDGNHDGWIDEDEFVAYMKQNPPMGF